MENSSEDMSRFLDKEVELTDDSELGLYYIRDKESKKLMTFQYSSNDEGYACYSNSVYIRLSYDTYESPYVLNSPEHALFVLHNNTPWYNSNYSTPSYSYSSEYNPDRYEIIDTEGNVIDVSMPTYKDFLIHKSQKYKHYLKILETYDNHRIYEAEDYDYLNFISKYVEDKYNENLMIRDY